MQRKNLICCFCLVLFTFSAGAQFNSNTWYFGEGAAIQFDEQGQVNNLSDGQILYNEGLSAITDCSNNLLLYSNSENVYNASHQIIKNGDALLGSHSSTQGALLVPLPNSCNQFYLFTLDDKENSFQDGLRYSIIDMNANAGQGEVISKNNLLYTQSTEKMCATHHANGTDIWIITHEYQTNNFRAYLLTESGIMPNPIVSSVGPVISRIFNGIGQMKASVNGDRLAYVNLRSGAALFDFDKTTGTVSNHISLDMSSSYGVEFSPDGSKLYTTFHALDYLNAPGAVYQFDLNAGSTAAINQSKTWIGSNPPLTDMRGLQLAPDGKIYVARSLGKHLGVIEHPNMLGLASSYVDSGFSLNNKICLWSLPSFVSSMIFTNPIINQPDFSFETDCVGKESRFQNESIGDHLTYEWDMGDGTQYQSKDVSHTYTQEGSYLVRLRTYKKCCFEERTQNIVIKRCPNKYFIPNSFSPNGDGKNDEWRIVGTTIKKIQMFIFNRWGQQIYNSNSLQFGWDGKLGGDPQPIGTYAFYTHIEFNDGEEKDLNGYIHLIR